MKNSYTYPCIFSYDEDGITVEFPDLPGCITSGQNEEEAFSNAKEVLEGFIYYMELDEDEFPEPTSIHDLKISHNQVSTLINVWMVPVRDEMNNKVIKKTLTIPKWINDVGVKNNINFSQLLQVAVKQYLDIGTPTTMKKRG
jgi:predicted RNase H-like HicB family nuclease